MRVFLLILLLNLGGVSRWWSVQTSGLDTNLRGVSVKHHQDKKGKLHSVIWASGSNGVILRSTDDGKTWNQLHVPGGSDLDFRDIEGFTADAAYVMSSGDGEKSKIYKTTDGGKSWKLQYSDPRPGFFLDSLACDSETHCLALSDPVEGKFLVLSTEDGEHWQELPRDRMPAALPKEGAFAASGTAITLCQDGKIYFGTGGPAARIFRSADQGRSWTVAESPIVSASPSRGVFSLACYGRDHLVAVGGDYKEPNRPEQVAAYSDDSGATWHLAAKQPAGYRSAVAFSIGSLVAVGLNGTDVSRDGGAHWRHEDTLNLNAESFDGAEGWAVGPNGTICHRRAHRY